MYAEPYITNIFAFSNIYQQYILAYNTFDIQQMYTAIHFKQIFQPLLAYFVCCYTYIYGIFIMESIFIIVYNYTYWCDIYNFRFAV